MMFCEHANEYPTSICRCKPSCGCRERMCREHMFKVSDQFGYEVLLSRVEACGVLRRGDHALASFMSSRLWRDPRTPRPEAWGCEKLYLTDDTVRDIVAGKLPIQQFNGVTVELPLFEEALSSPFHMVWGDFMLYETGEPVIRNFVAVPQPFVGLPPPMLVKRVLALLKASKNPL
jgi:hypothetical protein